MARTVGSLMHLDRKAYTVGWLTVLNVEFVAAISMLDVEHVRPETSDDPYSYVAGRVAYHNVVIACAGEAGPSSANRCATQMMRSFPNIKIGLLCGIGGAVPTKENDIRLGDVVVSKPSNSHGGVVCYDPGKLSSTGFKPLGHLNRPPLVLSNAAEYLEAQKALGRDQEFRGILSKAEATGLASREGLSDVLYEADDLTKVVSRKSRPARSGPYIHRGTIASGSWVIKTSGSKRGVLLKQINGDVLCFEMEAAGVMNDFPCLVVRGMSDYCDYSKNDDWHPYASMTAACYCKWLLNNIPRTEVPSTELAATIAEQDLPRFDSEEFRNAREAWSLQQLGKDPIAWSRLVSRISDYNPHKVLTRMCFTRLVGTTEWFLKHETFRQWVANSSTSSLWCSGSLGCGKTIVSSTVIKFLQGHVEETNHGVFFFYLDAAYPRTVDKTYVFRSLVKQQLEHLMKMGPQPDWEDICAVFSLVSRIVPRAYYVIDGLHEMEAEDIRNVLGFLLSLPPGKEAATTKIFLSSREELGWGVKLAPDLQIQITFQKTKDDLWRYIEAEITTPRCHRTLTSNLEVQKQIMQSLLKDAHGMFLWVHLQIETLRRVCTSDYEILEALKDLPPDLSSTYARCVERVPVALARITSKVLRWVCCSVRALHVDELAEIVGLDFTYRTWTSSHVQFHDAIVSSCGSLVVLDALDECIRLVHPSVKDFLTRSASVRPEQSLLDLDESDLKCGEECVKYLGLDDFKLELQQIKYQTLEIHAPSTFVKPGMLQTLANLFSNKLTPRSSTRPTTLRIHKPEPKPPGIQKYKFLQYAVENWALHTKKISTGSDTWNEFASLALQPNISWKIHPWTHSGRSLRSHLHGMLIYSSRERHRPLLRLLRTEIPWKELKSFCDLPSALEDGLNALQIAARLGFADIVEDLLSVCDVNAEGPSTLPALFYAIEKNELRVAEMLLRTKGVNLKAKGLNATSAISAAIRLGSLQMTTIILDSQNLTLSSSQLHEEIYDAWASGNVAAVSVVLELNIRGSIASHVREDFLRISARSGHEFLVRLILRQQEFTIDAYDSFGNTALHEAARAGNTSIAELLLLRGANINARTDSKDTPLSLAERHGEEHVMALLLRWGADINLMHISGSEFLYNAARHGHTRVVELLLRRHIDVNETGSNKETPLHAAAALGHEGVTKLLLLGGAEVNAASNSHQTPLHTAASGNSYRIVELLLQYGAEINSVDHKRNTALHLAAHWNYVAVASLLSQQENVDISVRNKEGRTALQEAAKEGHEAVWIMLLQQEQNKSKLRTDLKAALRKANANGRRLIRAILDSDI